jgi:transcriptional regulator with XRE-family HTH domain
MTIAPTAPGKSIRTLRLLAGLTLERTAQEAGVSAAYLSKVETGQSAASPRWLGHVAGVIASHLAGAG